jgi:histidinol dehydrogenase
MEIRYLENLSEDQREDIIKRKQLDEEIQEKVRSIIEEIKITGDDGLRKCALEFDGVEIEDIDITEKGKEACEEIDE